VRDDHLHEESAEAFSWRAATRRRGQCVRPPHRSTRQNERREIGLCERVNEELDSTSSAANE